MTQYVWYDTVANQRVGSFREGPYTVDGKPGTLPPDIVELRVVRVHDPIDLETQTYTTVNTVDVVGEKYIITQKAIPKPPPSVPYQVAPSALRMAMIDWGVDLGNVETLIDAVPDLNERKKVRVQWEYSTKIRRDHPLIISFGTNLGLSEADIDQIFINAELNYD